MPAMHRLTPAKLLPSWVPDGNTHGDSDEEEEPTAEDPDLQPDPAPPPSPSPFAFSDVRPQQLPAQVQMVLHALEATKTRTTVAARRCAPLLDLETSLKACTERCRGEAAIIVSTAEAEVMDMLPTPRMDHSPVVGEGPSVGVPSCAETAAHCVRGYSSSRPACLPHWVIVFRSAPISPLPAPPALPLPPLPACQRVRGWT